MSDLWSLAKRNDVAGLAELFSKGIGAKARDEQGATLLHHAAENGASDTMKLLFSKGADVDAKDNGGLTVRQQECSRSTFSIRFNNLWHQ